MKPSYKSAKRGLQGVLRASVAALTIVFCFNTSKGQTRNVVKEGMAINVSVFNDNTGHWYGIKDAGNMINPLPGKPRYKASEVRAIAENILLFQKNNGGWPKNYDMLAVLTPAQKDTVLNGKGHTNTTFDNGTTYTQVEYLAKAYQELGDERFKEGALKGFRFIVKAQYDNGGWPQYYPLESNYSRHITYNDGAFEGIMRVLKNVTDRDPVYDFVRGNARKELEVAYRKGMDCVLKTQIVEDGVPTAWCQQHDEKSLAPAWARKFEPPCISNGESAGIVLFLMSIEHPSAEVIKAVENAVQCFEKSKIYNTRVVRVDAPPMDTRYRHSVSDRVVKADSTAPPIWTRYYELKTHRPMFCNRDSKVVYSLAEVERERRDGYAWYVYAPQQVLDRYPDWKKHIAAAL